MRSYTYTDRELRIYLKQARRKGFRAMSNSLELVRGDVVMEREQSDPETYEDPSDIIREMGLDPKKMMFLFDDTDKNYWRIVDVNDMREALDEIEDRSEDPGRSYYWSGDFKSRKELEDFLRRNAKEHPEERYWYGDMDCFNGETYTAEEVLADLQDEWFEGDSYVMFHVFGAEDEEEE
ncbi:MAG: hypothetical protein SPK48_00890 [Bullifex sp.]|nr:hypothetical protein [Spirochaetales bacterium]MDY5776382.1 hypothetical protein [Bullifex sp.]